MYMEFVEIIKVVWHDMVTTPWGAFLGVVILFLFLFKDSIKLWLESLSKDKSSVYDKSDYSKKDVLNHPIFRDLDYWLNKGIAIVKIDKSYAKELIMKDLLKIKFSVIKDILTKAIQEDNLGDMNLIELKNHFYDTMREINTRKVVGWRNNGIPEVFIKKYLSLYQLGQEITYNTMKVFLTDEVKATNYTRVYLILSLLDTQLTNIFANAVTTALSLNGDLNGIIYKGVIIGATSAMYAIETPVCQDIIEEKLEELLVKTHSSRASVFLFHDFPGTNPFDGKYSCIYEKCAPGISSEKKEAQYCPAYLVSDYEGPFSKNEPYSGNTTDLNYGLSKLMLKNGSEYVVVYPLKDNDMLKGFIGVTWNYKEGTHTDEDLKCMLKVYANDIKKLVLGHK